MTGYSGISMSNNAVDYGIRELSRYCRERNVEPFELPEEELERFAIDLSSTC